MKKSIYERIHELARPYLDTRQNDIHVTICYALAGRLLGHHPKADPEVVLPAILLHDVGWKMVPEEKQLAAFGPNGKDMDTRRIHEVEGVVIAKSILESLAYDQKKTVEILAIIEGHDSREEKLSLNDALVKDADKLWRYSPVGLKIDHSRFGVDWHGHLIWLSRHIDTWFFTPVARDIAREGLAEAKAKTGKP